MIINSDKDGVLALTRKAFDSEIRTIYGTEKIIPENLPTYELLGHYNNDSEITAAYFRELTGRDENFDFMTYINEYCSTLKNTGIWRKFPYNGAILYFLERIRENAMLNGDTFRFNVITASGTNPEDRKQIGGDTRLWLDQCGLTDSYLMHETEKEKFLDCDIWIEDMPKYIIKIMKAGFKGRVFLIDHTYNKDETLKFKLTPGQFKRIRRIYPTLEIYRSHTAVDIDLALTLKNKSGNNKKIAASVAKLTEALVKKGVSIVKDPNHITELLGDNFALSFQSEYVNKLVSLTGSETATAILSRIILKIMKETLKNAKTTIEQYFVNERIRTFKKGAPLYIHFEFMNNTHLFNYDSINWFSYFRKKLDNRSEFEIKKKGKSAKCIIRDSVSVKSLNILRKAFIIDTINEDFRRELDFNDGKFSICLKGKNIIIEYSGPRINEI